MSYTPEQDEAQAFGLVVDEAGVLGQCYTPEDRGDSWQEMCFQSIEELGRSTLREHQGVYGVRRILPQGRRDPEGWWGTREGVMGVRRLMEQGWRSGTDKALHALQYDLELPKVPTARRRLRRTDFGNEIDMQAVYAGNLDRAWTVARREQEQSLGRVELLIESSAPWYVKSSDLFWRGATALAIAEVLVRSNRQCRIWGVHQSCHDGRNLLSSVILKHWHQPVVLDKIACTALGGFLRAYMFKALFTHPGAKDVDGFGVPISDAKVVPYEATNCASIYIGNDCMSLEGAKAALHAGITLVANKEGAQ